MLLKKLLTTSTADLQRFEEFSFLHVANKMQVDDIDNYQYDAIVVHDREALTEIRSRDDLYLSPIFTSIELGEVIHTDGIFDKLSPSFSIPVVRKIKIDSREFQNLEMPEEPNERILVKVLRFLVSRNDSLHPLRSRKSLAAYEYPLVSDMTTESHPVRLIKLIEGFHLQHYLKKEVMDKINLCKKCESAYHNFSESCSSCGSLDLSTENLIHHFRCAYVGPESDFKTEEGLKCPKCSHNLKHIGIDYDKPSEIHNCNSCGYHSQETKMIAKCIDCGYDNALDQLSTHTISKYFPTEKGRNKAKEKITKQDITIEEIGFDSSGVTAYPIYNILSNHERLKFNNYDNEMYVMQVVIKESVLINLNEIHKRNLLNEIAGITKPYLKGQDLITVTPDNKIECLLIDYKLKSIKDLISMLEYNIEKMISDNQLSSNKAVLVSTRKMIEA